MKLLLLLLFSPIISLSQEKGVNTIIVKGVSFDTVINKMLDAGFFIDTKDTTLGTIITMPIDNTKFYQSNLIIRVRIKDSTAFISGLTNANLVLNIPAGATLDYRTYDPVVNKGMKGSYILNAFNRLKEFALSLKGEISYLKQ